MQARFSFRSTLLPPLAVYAIDPRTVLQPGALKQVPSGWAGMGGCSHASTRQRVTSSTSWGCFRAVLLIYHGVAQCISVACLSRALTHTAALSAPTPRHRGPLGGPGKGCQPLYRLQGPLQKPVEGACRCHTVAPYAASVPHRLIASATARHAVGPQHTLCPVPLPLYRCVTAAARALISASTTSVPFRPSYAISASPLASNPLETVSCVERRTGTIRLSV